MKKCIICNETNALHTLHAKNGNTIIICDSCYQEVSRIEFLPNRRHIEFVEEKDIKFYNTLYWNELKITWNDVE